MDMRRPTNAGILVFVAVLAVACGGGGGGGGGGSNPVVPAPSPSLTITAASPTQPVPGGGAATVDITLSNSGTAAATGVTLTTLPGAGLTQGAVTCAPSGGATCPSIAGNAINVGALPAGSSLAFQVALAVAAGSSGAISSTATVVASNVSSSAPRSVSFVVNAYSADIQVTGAAATSRVIEGGAASYTMTVVNAGPDAARDVTITNVLDGDQVPGAVMCTAAGSAVCPTTLGASMTVTSLPKDGSLTFTIPASVPVTGVTRMQTNQMSAQAAGDPDGTDNAATASVEATPPNSIQLRSDFNDYIGAGRSYQYSRSNAQLQVTATGGLLSVRVDGDENWSAEFQLPRTLTQFQPGTYANLMRYPFHDPAVGGLNWSGEGRGCNTLRGAITVSRAIYANGVLEALDLSFEQFCEGGAGALRGQIHWTNLDTSLAPGPVNPPPAGLWSPAPGATPVSGSYVYLQSEFGDYIGGGSTYTYTRANAQLNAVSAGGLLQVSIRGDQDWSGDFQAMIGLAQLQPGYYGDLQRYPFHNPVKGGLSWSGQGRGCNTLRGWFVVDSISYSNGELAAVELRFEQRCEGGSAALRGKIRVVANDTTSPPGPVEPPPAGLWSPAPGATPDSGNYVYLQSDFGDYIGGGGTYTYTGASAQLNVTAAGGLLQVSVTGDQDWDGQFQAMLGLAQLQPGYYGDLRRYPFHNPVKGGLSWSGEGRGCNTLRGWFVVDSISYSNGELAAVELRFEQRCEGGAAALRGKIRVVANDTASPPGPVVPPPSGLWSPAPGATPDSGNYVYLQSDAGDYIGGGRTYTYTGSNATFSLDAIGSRVSVVLSGNESWIGEFQGMTGIARLQPGYYGDLQRYPFHNPVKGGLSWSGEGRGCNSLRGWFVVDSVSYDVGGLASITLRFQQNCEGRAPALRGKISWSR
jgi:uncharacterized repeat protein (TIGR01451 family)